MNTSTQKKNNRVANKHTQKQYGDTRQSIRQSKPLADMNTRTQKKKKKTRVPNLQTRWGFNEHTQKQYGDTRQPTRQFKPLADMNISTQKTNFNQVRRTGCETVHLLCVAISL